MTASAQTPPPAQPADIMQEVRFAVVMYGGVSLAIYINGVAQQLLDMVRSTATDASGRLVYSDDERAAPDRKLSASGKIYRRIAKFLNSRTPNDALLQTDDPAAMVRTKFVVDVISGTSAGGLNGIFLGKALANDQSMGPLQNLWMQEGDLARLLNDGVSVKDEPALDAAKVKRPESLLNSERMYEQLLLALHGMDFPKGTRSTSPDEKRDGRQPSPLVEELDVFVTTTDLAGLPVHIQLANTVADERRHRNVFHFRYCTEEATGEAHDDFGVQCNPFLAFAGRCTSSFPFAFEPMQLKDIWSVLEKWTTYQQSQATWLQDWGRFFEDYTTNSKATGKSAADFQNRAFGDGGYLDNKPFTYATRTLMRRHAVCPVERKLLYVEPAPEIVGSGGGDGKKPNVVANVTAALLTLPRYETIRDDLQDIIERNKLFRQIADLTAKVDADVRSKPASNTAGTVYEQTPLYELVKTHGVFYGTYHRLKVEEVTAHLASTIAFALDFDPQSDEREAIRLILKAWREKNYRAGESVAEPPDGRKFESHFLLSFDLGYRLRRLFFIQARINRLAAAEINDEIQRLLRTFKKIASRAVKQLRIAERRLQEDPALLTLLSTAEIFRSKALLQVLGDPPSAARIAHDHARPIQDITARISEFLGVVFKAASDGLKKNLERTKRWNFTRPAKIAGGVKPNPARIRRGLMPAAAAAAATQEIERLYREFEWYDMVIFPLQQGTDAAESRHVDIIRISPPDSPNLIPGENADRQKLAGTYLWAFGAFLARKWRENDMLWGKLDAAEIIIRNLLAADPVRTRHASKETVNDLVNEMHRAILNESLTPDMRNQMYNLICAAIADQPRAQWNKEGIRQILSQLNDFDERLKKVLRCCLDEDELLGYFRKQYMVDTRLEPKDTLRLAGRAARVVGKMAEVLSDGSGASTQAKFFSRLASGFWALVEISVPRSFAWNQARHLRALCYLIGGVLIALGLLWHPALAPGAVIFSATLALHVITAWLHALMKAGESGWKNAARWLLIGAAAVLVGLAAWGAFDLAQRLQHRAGGGAAEPAKK